MNRPESALPYRFQMLLPFLLALTIALPWWIPSTSLGAALAWLAPFFLVLALRSAHPYWNLYIGGVISYALGFYWLFPTISEFGGFTMIPAAVIFLLFVTASAMQYIVLSFIYLRLPRALDRYALRSAIAWTVSEFISFKIFPWCLGHTQIGFPAFAQIADLGGVYLISFLMVWVAQAIIDLFDERGRDRRFFLAPAVFLLFLAYGAMRQAQFIDPVGQSQSVALIQANIQTAEKHNIKFFLKNTERYVELTKKVAAEGMLVIWPETVISEWISAKVGVVAADERLPYLKNVSMLVGALTFDAPEQLYNSALAIFADGTVPEPYHKQVLMPFGEYTPLSKTFPWLKEINATVGDFTPGQDIKVIKFPMGNDSDHGYTLALSPLICYEDVLPELSRRAALSGAELLVNITNDAWFGNTAAPYQHHMIASFRAIENRRFLLRATNSGLTAIVNPLGQTISQLPLFSDGTLVNNVVLMNHSTLYTRFFGDRVWWILVVFCFVAIVLRKRCI